MTAITLRPARSDEAPALARVHLDSRRIAMPFLPRLHSEAETYSWMADQVLRNQTVWVAELEGEVAGYIALDGDMVEALYVAPDRQGRGVGSALLDKAKALSPGGLRLYCFNRNAPARAFYEARGFVAIEFTDGARNEEREPDVLYRWVALGSSALR